MQSGRTGPVIAACLAVVLGVIVLAAFGPILAPLDPAAQNLASVNAPPSGVHWLGTDALGRDILSRIIVGARTAFVGAFVIAATSFLFGNLLGLLAGYRGGWVDAILMRWVDMMWSIPTLLVLIVFAGIVGAQYWPSVAVLVVLTVPFDVRVVRGATLEQVPRPYVEAAKTLGVPAWRIMLLHIWPNVSASAIANAFLVFADALVVLSGLSFLGLGVPPGTPDWGLMLAENVPLLFVHPVASLAPGALIVLTASSMNLIGDWLQEQLATQGEG
ncbi:ABC transporter permease [Mesorhizobium sp.]|uniref:ABC transporter permease n=1 Tax=Mesorhizobium sp. TaxID=1871066 RepID=UPI000FE5AA5E|nr:ABC transporter permease [Mesorhizobium sp.]RWJ01199.1 MAG: ABC transporter permease [Mesorhizobium sp.]TIP91880.1 MAG: ABC transporter permease [Mesorhizobium sp.]